MNKLVYLITGIVVTIVFIALAYSSNPEVNIFDLIYYNQEFNDGAYSCDLYPLVAFIVSFLAWGGAAVYYFAINSVNFDRWYHWAGVLGIVTLFAPILCYWVVNGALSSFGYDLSGATLQFVTRLFVIEALLFIVASFSMRWWSSNCRHTPFPQ